MKKQKSDYWLSTAEDVVEVFSRQLCPKDGKIHVVFISYVVARYGLAEAALSYLQEQDKELVDFRYAQDGGAEFGIISMMIFYK